MIITNEVEVKIIPKTLKYFRSLEYNVNVGDVIKIPIIHLNRRSRVKVNVKCDVCGHEKLLPYQKYTKSIEVYNYYSCSQKCSVDKCKKTFMMKYGVDSPMALEEFKKKGKQTKKLRYDDERYNNQKKCNETKLRKYGSSCYNNIEKIKETIYNRYGVDNIMQIEEIVEKVKNSKINNGHMLPDEVLSDFKSYKRNAMKITRRNKSTLLESWDGIDYYDGEYIKNNLILKPIDRNYPTVDHKISIFQGFLNSIDYKIIGSIDNLCVTKKYLNSKKGFSKSSDVFKSSTH